MRDLLSLLNENSGALTVLFSALVTAATLVYAALTWKLVAETRRMRKAQTDARLSIGLSVSEKWVNFIDLVVRNEGVGPAYDVEFVVSPVDASKCDQTIVDFVCNLGFVTQGIGYISPGHEIRSFLTSMAQEFERKITTAINVEIAYTTSAGERLVDTYLLDFSVFKGIRQLGTPPLHAMAKSLEQIQKDLHDFTSGFRKAKVIAYTKKEIETEEKERLREVERMEAEANSDGS